MSLHGNQQFQWKKESALPDERIPQMVNGGVNSAATSSTSFTLNSGGNGGPGSSMTGAGPVIYNHAGYTSSSSPTTIPISGGGQTIEEQIKLVDRISKDCDLTRKQLEQINRRLDDLNDEVRRYREFLGHEKSRRDPALYKTTSSNSEQPSAFNENICGIIGSLTSQLTMEWSEKLRFLQTQSLVSSSRHNAERS